MAFGGGVRIWLLHKMLSKSLNKQAEKQEKIIPSSHITYGRKIAYNAIG